MALLFISKERGEATDSIETTNKPFLIKNNCAGFGEQDDIKKT
jgi:hypothetical protein